MAELAINPNSRIPALTDVDKNGKEIQIFESGAILEYLVAQYDKDHKVSYPYNSPEYWETVSWLTWQMAGVGPMQGQANHFASKESTSLLRFAGEQVPYALNCYVHETRRLYRVLAITWPRAPRATSSATASPSPTLPFGPGSALTYSGLLSIDEFPHVKKWLYTLLVCPGFEEGCNAPGPHRYLNMNDMSEEELNSIAASLGTWIIDAMKRDAEA
ncbi:unnamed protein product [Clonostachys rosea f. rosea IK726]|uniref:Uncharacterized protein n=1 Tax=Clonostachys rosea f. rosea IK726 TaxID=1349383 RepID=A0ACA9UAS6_BIOOC|nr:unnamed protein product [Clonostachys rosea f. rosea IK726]